MNKNAIYILIAVVAGLVAGYILFSGGSPENENGHDHSIDSESNQMWTCSMHPQIMQPEPGDCPICGMDLIPAEAGADGLAPGQFKMTANALALANVQTSVVGNVQQGSESTISLSGKIAVNEESLAVQASYFDGRIERLNVNYEGQEISKGQQLATIYSPELVAAQQELITTASLKETQPQLYQAVRNKLKLWKLSENQIGKIESSGKVLEFFPIYATVSGTVSEMMSSEGDYVKKGQPIAKLSDLNTVWAEFDVYENQLSHFRTGQRITITTNAYPNDKFEGVVSFIDPVLNNATRTVTLRATLNNSNDKFKPGMFISGEVDTDRTVNYETSLLVPSSAVMWTGERSLVYVKAKSNEPIFEMREVILGERIGEFIAITFGLHSGEEIVTNGTFTVDAAAQLQGKKSMMNKSGGKILTGHEAHLGSQGDTGMGNMEETMTMEFPESFQSSFESALTYYLNLKDAMVEGDSEMTSTNAQVTLDALKKFDITELGDMEKTHFERSIDILELIANNDDLKSQRDYFVTFNDNIVAIAGSLVDFEDTFYVQRCPMANNNQGAVWISSEPEIRNPYYGDAMLKCGSVIATYKNGEDDI